MPAASWPRCCKACSPSAVSAAASGCPQMPKTPHSSWNLSSKGCDRQSLHAMPRSRFRSGGGASSSRSSWFWSSGAMPGLARPASPDRWRRRVGPPAPAPAPRHLGSPACPGAGALAAQPLHDLRLRIVRQPVHQIGAERIEPRLRFRHGDPFRLPLRGDEEVQEQHRDDDEDQAARRAEHEAERAVERPGARIQHEIGDAHRDDRDDEQRDEEEAGDGDAERDVLVLDVALHVGQQRRPRRNRRRRPRRPMSAMEKTSRVKPRIMASTAEISTTKSRIPSSSVKGIKSCLLQAAADARAAANLANAGRRALSRRIRRRLPPRCRRAW